MVVASEIREFLILVQNQFSEAYLNGDGDGMYESSYALTRTYAAVGNLMLAGRWAHECETHTKDPGKLFALNMTLLCGLIQQKYLKSGN